MSEVTQVDELTPEERTVIELFRACEGVDFNRYNDSNDEAKKFVSILGKPEIHERDGLVWFSNGTGKIHVSAFIKLKGGE